MFGVFQKLGLLQKNVPPSVTRIGVAQAEDCAMVHAASFTYSWPAPDIEALLLASSTFADGAFCKAKKMQGFILSRRAADEAEILTIAVLPRRRGLGIAGRLMKANMARLQADGAKSWFLEVESQNAAALALYDGFGFKRVGERKSYYRTAGGEAALAYILRRSLH